MSAPDATPCTSCGEPVDAVAKFCPNCGTARVVSGWVGSAAPAPPPPPLPPPPPPPPPPREELPLPPVSAAPEASEEELPPPPVSAAPEASEEDLSQLPPPPAVAATATVPTPVTVASPVPVAPPTTADQLPPPPAAAVPAPPGPPSGSPNRVRAIVVGVVVGLVVLGVALAVHAATSHTDHKAATPVTKPTVSSPPATAPTTGAVAPTTAVAVGNPTDTVVRQIDGALTASAAQVKQLRDILDGFDPVTPANPSAACGLSGSAAAAQAQQVIAGRQSIVAQLGAIPTGTTPTGTHLVTLLRNAITLSLQSDNAFQSWMAANSSTDGTVPCARIHDSNWQTSQAIAARASQAKQAFLGAYLSQASQVGVRANWKYTDF